MATIYIEGKPYTVDSRRNLLEVCLELGFNLPYFCWHPAMGSVGACRQCAITQFKDENDTQGKLVMSCMTAATDGTRISLAHPEAAGFRKEVIEWLMTNHPHDCPVCEEGGECHLQDMTVMSGQTYRRYRHTKRTHENQYLGPFINHEMNRCIACYRCVRYYQDYAGGKDLSVFASRNNVYFGRAQEGVLESEFSGNLVEVCPTGVFTDKTLSENYARKWDLQTAPSVCTHCGLGCNTNPGERYGELRRIVNRYHGEINGYFICDRGRFGYQFVNREDRPRQPTFNRPSGPKHVSAHDALSAVAPMIAVGTRVWGIGSPRASLETNFALKRMVGADRFSTGMIALEQQLLDRILKIQRDGPADIPTLREVEAADAVLVLGEDVSNTAPRLALALRQSVREKSFELADQHRIPQWQDAAVRTLAQNERSPLFIVTPVATRIDEIALRTRNAAPEAIARLGHAIANAIDSSAPAANGLEGSDVELAAEIAKTLSEAHRPLIVSGPGCQSAAVIEAAANIAWALGRKGRTAQLCLTTPESNSLGVTMLGGQPLETVLGAIEKGQVDTLVVAENALFRRVPRERLDTLLPKLRHLIVLDHVASETVQRAEVVLPAGSFAESDGTVVNNEGRAQRFFQTYSPDPASPLAAVQESWRWLRDMQGVAGLPNAPDWKNLDDVTRACAAANPALAGITEAAPSAGFRRAGVKMPRMSPRSSGRTAMRANISVHEPRQPQDPDSPLAFTMEGVRPNEAQANVVPLVWMPAWNSNQAITKFQDEIGGSLRGGDTGVRLIEGNRSASVSYFAPLPSDSGARTGLQVIPLHHIFGSEELSAKAPAVIERIPEPCVLLSAETARELGFAEMEPVRVRWNGHAITLPVVFEDSLPANSIGMVQGLPGVPVVGDHPVRLEKAAERPS